MWERARAGLRLVFRLDRDRLEILGLEDLPAVETFDVVHTIAAGDDYCFFMLAGGLHRERSGLRMEDTDFFNDPDSDVKGIGAGTELSA